MIQFQRTIFAECGPRVGSHDWEVIMAFDSKSSDMNTLRLILYPTTGDIKNGDLVRKYLRLDSKWFSIRALPQLESPRVLGSKPFSTRGPGSLAQLSDIGFHACFDSLAGIPSLKCPTWSNLVCFYPFFRLHCPCKSQDGLVTAVQECCTTDKEGVTAHGLVYK